MAQILKGAPVVAAMNEANAARCAALKEKGIVPTLAVVRVGAREDDISYEKGIVTRTKRWRRWSAPLPKAAWVWLA